LLLFLIAGIGYGVFSCARFVSRTVFPEVRVERALLANEPLLSGRAVVLRDEVVVVAERAGVLNRLHEHGQTISAGEVMFEIVDRNRLVAIDRQLEEEAQQMETTAAQSAEIITHRRTELAQAQSVIRDLAARYAHYLRAGDSALALRAFAELGRAHSAAQKRAEEYSFAARSQEEFAKRRADLLHQRRQAILSVTSPVSGVLNFGTDGRESILRAGDYRSVTLATIKQVGGAFTERQSMDTIVAGQAVGSIVDPTRIVLLMEATSLALGRAVRVSFGEVSLAATVLPVPASGETSATLLALEVMTPPASLLTTRVVNVAVQPEGETLTKVPVRAIVTTAQGDVVYVKVASGELTERRVLVRQTRARVAVVSGLNVDELVVTNPEHVKVERTTP